MRAYNFVIVLTQDFDQVQYRIRAIDFDQQSFEKRCRIYLPQFYKDNVFFVQLTDKSIPNNTVHQYQMEERALLKKRYLNDKYQIDYLIAILKHDKISFDEHVECLKLELSKYHKFPDFKKCKSMGEILELNIKTMLNL